MQGLSNDKCDDLALRLSGLIGTFDLLVSTTTEDRSQGATMADFFNFMSRELQGLYKAVTGIEYCR